VVVQRVSVRQTSIAPATVDLVGREVETFDLNVGGIATAYSVPESQPKEAALKKLGETVAPGNEIDARATAVDVKSATIGDDGIYRDGSRVTSTVKDALMAATRLRDDQGGRVFAYPILVSTLDAERHQLDRLGVVAGDRIAEYIWSHPGLPLRRSQRLEVQWALRRPLR